MAETDEVMVKVRLKVIEIDRFEREIIDIANGRHPVVLPCGLRLDWPANDPGAYSKRSKGPAPV